MSNIPEYKAIEGDEDYIAISKQAMLTLTMHIKLLHQYIEAQRNFQLEDLPKISAHNVGKMTINEQEETIKNILNY